MLIIPSNNKITTTTSNLYLVSEAFYKGFDGTEEMSVLESCLAKYMRNEVVPVEDIEIIRADIPNWNVKEQYNYIPMLLLVMKHSLQNTYDRI